MRAWLVLPLVLSLSACNWINHVTGLSKGSDRATGAACRQTGRSLEECYRRNPDADKAQIFAGWREMHEYMVKQQLPTMSPPPEPPPQSAAASSPTAQADSSGAGADTGDGKADPEVQAVLDTIGNRPKNNHAGDPSKKEEEQLQKMLNQQAGKPEPDNKQ